MTYGNFVDKFVHISDISDEVMKIRRSYHFIKLEQYGNRIQGAKQVAFSVK